MGFVYRPLRLHYRGARYSEGKKEAVRCIHMKLKVTVLLEQKIEGSDKHRKNPSTQLKVTVPHGQKFGASGKHPQGATKTASQLNVAVPHEHKFEPSGKHTQGPTKFAENFPRSVFGLLNLADKL